ncbi:hypothetical protein C1J01_32190, partial [Nonomuraea aridisoli]
MTGPHDRGPLAEHPPLHTDPDLASQDRASQDRAPQDRATRNRAPRDRGIRIGAVRDGAMAALAGSVSGGAALERAVSAVLVALAEGAARRGGPIPAGLPGELAAQVAAALTQVPAGDARSACPLYTSDAADDLTR